MSKLVITTEPLCGVVHLLGESWTTIGRSDGNMFQIGESSVSGRHCEVKARGDELLVRDLNSTNGTFLGGSKASEGVVKFGQSFRIGNVDLRFERSGSRITLFQPYAAAIQTGSRSSQAHPKIPCVICGR